MKRQTKILGLLLAGLCLLTGCAQESKDKSDVVLPDPTEETIVLDEQKLQIENMSPYEGVYIEKGEDENKDRVTGVYALAFTNTSETTIKDAHLVFSDGEQELNFYLEMLPYGSTVTVVEFDKKTVKSGDLQLVSSEVNYLEVGLEGMEYIDLIDSDIGMIVVENMTLDELPQMEIYYRRGYGNGTLGGPCYKVELDGMQPKEIVNPEAEDWSQHSVIVNVLLYPDVSEEP